MKTRIGFLALMMTAAGLFIQPATVAASDFGHDRRARVEQRNDIPFARQYREHATRRNDRFDNHRDHDDHYRSSDRGDFPRGDFRR